MANPPRTHSKYLLYWMQQAQRATYNPALDYACAQAEALSLPLIVVFVLSPQVPEANLRHYSFMLQGLLETAATLHKQGISLFLAYGNPPEIIAQLASEAVELIADHGYLRYQREWREMLQIMLKDSRTIYTEIETEPLIPVAVVSDHEEYAAATIRRKLLRKIGSDFSFKPKRHYLLPAFRHDAPGFQALHRFDPEKPQLTEIWWNNQLQTDDGVPAVKNMKAGHTEALRLLNTFLKNKLPLYATQRNEPSLDIQSGLSPYLHFGQICTMEIIQRLSEHIGLNISELPELIISKEDRDPVLMGARAFAEELVIRRELSFNYCWYNEAYDSFAGLPAWAKSTLLNHLSDPREQHYLLDSLEQCATHDVYWNAAQWEMMTTGKMHNYLRMYWGKRVLAWCDNPEDAYQILLYLNNRYSLDGRDPNSFAGIAWCFGKHDRPWQNRSIYGSVRYMNARGLERKFDMKGYLSRIGYPEQGV
ncbi:MAG: deoxyribodipyrimidine photo-lyase [Candidatus Cloacimonetes bacterium]|nr:deoxyribodipyrimidine photo-lyase [Candidatus Cloacimonadota bacterium]